MGGPEGGRGRSARGRDGGIWCGAGRAADNGRADPAITRVNLVPFMGNVTHLRNIRLPSHAEKLNNKVYSLSSGEDYSSRRVFAASAAQSHPQLGNTKLAFGGARREMEKDRKSNGRTSFSTAIT